MDNRQSEFLELRQQIKDSIRNKKKIQNGEALTPSTPEQRNIKLNEFGSFFGPSEPVIAKRVLQERKEMAAKLLNPIQIENAKQVTSTPLSKKRKAEILKDSRDYSFLLSDDIELPSSTPSSKESNSKPVSLENQTGSSTLGLARKPVDHKRKVLSSKPKQGRVEQRKVSQKELTSSVPRQSLLSRTGSSRKPDSIPVDRRRKLLSSNPKQGRVVEQRKVSQELTRPSQTVPRKSLQPSQQLKKKKKIVKMSEESIEALRMIRKMCNTDRYKGRDCDDDENMESNFDDILKEEKRSERLGKKEDAEQKKLIEEEERRERLRKEMKKKQKLSH